MSHPDIRCTHNQPVQMLPDPCFTLEQFIEAIQLVQCGSIPPSAPRPYGWPYRLEGEDCVLHAQHDGDSLTNVTDNNTDISVGDTDCDGLADVAEDHANVSIDDIWIGPMDNSNPLASGGEEDAPERQAVDANASVETLVDIDPASWYNWFKQGYGAGKVTKSLVKAVSNEQCTSSLSDSVRYMLNTISMIVTKSIIAMFQDLDTLYMELGYKAGVPEHNTILSRFLVVLQRINTEGWDVISPELEDVCTFVQNLHQCATNLAENIQQCEQLLHLTTRQLAAEREFIAMVDQGGTEAYDNAVLAGSLSWQTPPE
ncbi:hypothetical protein F4604DRAFT_1926282 [Suillus subluteus]|nr:hypothetical protein F4604DRAFT_1926282 [Suillus subluteus]